MRPRLQRLQSLPGSAIGFLDRAQAVSLPPLCTRSLAGPAPAQTLLADPIFDAFQGLRNRDFPPLFCDNHFYN